MAPIVIKQRSTGNLFADSYRVVRNGKTLGREYCIKGIYTLWKMGKISRVFFPEDVESDLSAYEAYRDEQKSKPRARKKHSRLETEAGIEKEL